MWVLQILWKSSLFADGMLLVYCVMYGHMTCLIFVSELSCMTCCFGKGSLNAQKFFKKTLI